MTSRRVLALTLALCSVGTAFAGEPVAREAIELARTTVMARQEFHYREQDASSSSLIRFLMTVQQWMQRMQEEHPFAFWTVFAVLFLVALLLLAHVLWTVRASGHRRRAAPKLDLEDALRRADPTPFRARAIACAERGEFDEAVRALYTALLLRFDRLGHVRFARHKAVLDYRIEISGRPAARDTLEQFCDIYHPGSFGRRPPTRPQFDALLAAYDGMGA